MDRRGARTNPEEIRIKKEPDPKEPDLEEIDLEEIDPIDLLIEP